MLSLFPGKLNLEAVDALPEYLGLEGLDAELGFLFILGILGADMCGK